MTVNLAHPVTTLNTNYKVFRLNPPVQSEDVAMYYDFSGDREIHYYDYVAVSSAKLPSGEWETAIFPATADGKIADYIDLPGSSRGKHTPEEALSAMGGYVIE